MEIHWIRTDEAVQTYKKKIDKSAIIKLKEIKSQVENKWIRCNQVSFHLSVLSFFMPHQKKIVWMDKTTPFLHPGEAYMKVNLCLFRYTPLEVMP